MHGVQDTSERSDLGCDDAPYTAVCAKLDAAMLAAGKTGVPPVAGSDSMAGGYVEARRGARFARGEGNRATQF